MASNSQQFDLVVIGAGPGGYVAAIRAAQLGMSVACIDKRDTLGGTCLNVGCIPSKALLHASHMFGQVSSEIDHMGIHVAAPGLDIERMLAYKQEIVDANTVGIEFLFKKNKVTWIKGVAEISSPGTVEITSGSEANSTLTAMNILIATGSDCLALPGIEIDEKQIVSSTGALSLAKVPRTMIVIGAGAIGLELGSVWARLGAQVTIVELLDRILPEADLEVAKTFARAMKKQGLTFRLGAQVTGAKATKSGVALKVGDETLKADVVLVAIGRRPISDGLGLQKLGIETTDRGCICTDTHYQTTVPGIFAIGDVIDGPMLAHKAEDEGVAVAEHLAGGSGHVNYGAIPSVVYTMPEVAWVGSTEEALKAEGIDYAVGKFPFTASAKARISGVTDGFVKVLADKASDRVLGVHIISEDASHLIAEAVSVMEFGGSAEDIARTCHAHPTLSEAVKEAALAVDGRALHI